MRFRDLAIGDRFVFVFDGVPRTTWAKISDEGYERIALGAAVQGDHLGGIGRAAGGLLPVIKIDS